MYDPGVCIFFPYGFSIEAIIPCLAADAKLHSKPVEGSLSKVLCILDGCMYSLGVGRGVLSVLSALTKICRECRTMSCLLPRYLSDLKLRH